ncbi:MAG: type II toxin-antitoxin system RelE/ParE family toxin [Polyangiaceae bacterium]
MIRFRPEAVDDLANILTWYRDYPGRAERFERSLDETFAILESSPLAFQILDPPDIRLAPLRKFPQGVVYVVVGDDVDVLAIFDGRRKPATWK